MDERTCIVIRKFEELQSDGDQFINRLAGMSMRYTYCHIIILMDADSLLVSGNAAKLNNVLMKLAASLSNHFPIETHMTYCYSMAACADAVALSAYRTGRP